LRLRWCLNLGRGMCKPLMKVIDDFGPRRLVAIDVKAALRPFARRLPLLRLVAADRRLPVHLDHRHYTELVY
jgi:hypothetical protein